MYRMDRYHRENRIARYFRRTWVNKLFAVAFVSFTYFAAKFTGDAGGFVFSLLFAVPMFFAKTNWFKSN